MKNVKNAAIAALSLAGVTTALTAVLWTRNAEAQPPAKAMKPAAKSGAKAAPAATKPANPVGDNTPLTEDQKILHVLNRLGYGARPGDVAKVKAMGLDKYVALQLTPDRVNDNVLDEKLKPLSLLTLTPQEYATMYADRQKKIVKTIKAKQKVDEGTAKGATPQQQMQELTPEEREALREAAMAQQQIRMLGFQLMLDKTVRAVESERQFQEVMVDFWSNHFNIDVRKNQCSILKPVDERDVIRKNAFGKFRDLLGASAKSPAMLVYLDNAQSSAPMPDVPPRRRPGAPQQPPPPQQQQRRRGGLNENYAREIMELHTLGVDNGYTQKDIIEVARCLTGWTLNPRTGEFIFTPVRHDRGEKTVLGVTIPAGGGIEDGEKVLDMLASNPNTMRFISTKLCRRLVADEPPASLVDKCVATWKRTDGDLREIYRTIVTSPEFYTRAAYRQKIKSPFEYAVSSVRAVGGTFRPEVLENMASIRVAIPGNNARGMNINAQRTVVGQIAVMGQPLYQYQAPTGYPEDSRKWVSSGALISRLNFSLALASGRLADIDVSGAQKLVEGTPDTALLVNRVGDSLLNGEMTPSTRATLLKQATTTPGNAEAAATDGPFRVVALVLGSPEFQRR